MLGHVTSSYRSAALGPDLRARAGQGRSRPDRRAGARAAGRPRRRGDDRRVRAVRPGEPAPRRGAGRMTTTDRRERSASWGRCHRCRCVRTRSMPRCSHGSATPWPPCRRRSRTPSPPRPTARATSCGSVRTSGWSSRRRAHRRRSPPPSKPPSAPPPATRSSRPSTSPRTGSASRSPVPGAADLLASGCALDLERGLPVGGCAQTLLARANVVLWHVADDPEPVYRVLVRPSFVRYLVAWLRDALEA